MNILPNWMINMVNEQNRELKRTYETLENAGINTDIDRQHFRDQQLLDVKDQTEYLQDKYSEYFK